MSVQTIQATIKRTTVQANLTVIAGANGGTSATWGGVSGVLANQTDLQTALNTKQSILFSPVNQTISFTAFANNYYRADATSGNIIATLPTTNTLGQEIVIKKKDATVNTVVISGTINGNVGTNLTLRLSEQGKVLIGDGTGNWNVYAGDLTLPTLDARYYGVGNTSNYIPLTALSATGSLAYNNTTGVFTIQTASTSLSGVLSSTDWNAFNTKQSTLGYTPANIAGDTFTGNIIMSGTGALTLPQGTTAQQPSPTTGMVRFNTTTSRHEFYTGAVWANHARLSGDTFTGAISATNLSGTNTGDETNGTILTKIGYTPANKAGDTFTGNIIMSGTGALTLPQGTTAQQPSPTTGMVRFNTTTSRHEFYTGTVWANHARLSGDTFTGAISATNLSGTNTGDLAYTAANIAGDTFTGALNIRQISSILQNGTDAISFATSKDSYTLEFETSNWTGSVEQKNRFKWNSVANTGANSSQFNLNYNSTNFLKVDSGGFIQFAAGIRTVVNDGSTVPTFTFNIIQNTNSTVNNMTTFSANRNQGNMFTGYTAWRNISHSATVGSAELSVWLGNAVTPFEQYKFENTGRFVLMPVSATAPTSNATQISSGRISLESNNWTGSATVRRRFHFENRSRTTTSDTSDLYVIYESADLFRFNASGAAYCFGPEYGLSNSQTSIISPATPALLTQNTNTTVNNFESVKFRNANGMDLGYISLRNLDHSATIGSGELSIWLANGATAAEKFKFQKDGILNLIENTTIASAITDGFAAANRSTPTYTGAFTVTRHNYIDLLNPILAGSAALTDATVMRFDAAAGTHKAVDAATTKITPGSVSAWIKVNIAGVIYFIPTYTSKTT